MEGGIAVRGDTALRYFFVWFCRNFYLSLQYCDSTGFSGFLLSVLFVCFLVFLVFFNWQISMWNFSVFLCVLAVFVFPHALRLVATDCLFFCFLAILF